MWLFLSKDMETLFSYKTSRGQLFGLHCGQR